MSIFRSVTCQLTNWLHMCAYFQVSILPFMQKQWLVIWKIGTSYHYIHKLWWWISSKLLNYSSYIEFCWYFIAFSNILHGVTCMFNFQQYQVVLINAHIALWSVKYVSRMSTVISDSGKLVYLWSIVVRLSVV